MLRNSHYVPDFDTTLGGTNPTARSSQPTPTSSRRIALRTICDAWCEALAAHRQYEQLRSRGISHDTALRESLGIGLARSPVRCVAAKPLSFAGKA